MCLELSHLPEGWSDNQLGSLVSFCGGYGFPDRFQGMKDGGYPFYKVSDMSLPGNDRYLANAKNYVSKQVSKQNGWAPFPAGAVAFAKVGAALLLNRRRILTQGSLIDNNMMVAIPAAIDETFLYWWLQSIDFSIFVQPGAVPSVNQSQLGSLPIRLPTSIEQRRIAEILDTLDDAIQKTEQLIAKLKQIKQGLLHDLLTRGIDENGQLRDPIAHPEQFKDSVLGRIPKEWNIQKLGEVLSMQAGNTLASEYISENGSYPVYGGNGMRGYTSTFTHDGMFVLIGRQGALCGNIVVATGKFYATEHAIVVTPMEPTSVGWLKDYLTEMNLNQYSESSAQPGLSVQKISRLPVAVPRFEEQGAIDSILTGIEREIANELDIVRKYNSIKKALMHDLLTGKVRVTTSTQEAAHV